MIINYLSKGTILNEETLEDVTAGDTVYVDPNDFDFKEINVSQLKKSRSYQKPEVFVERDNGRNYIQKLGGGFCRVRDIEILDSYNGIKVYFRTKSNKWSYSYKSKKSLHDRLKGDSRVEFVQAFECYKDEWYT